VVEALNQARPYHVLVAERLGGTLRVCERCATVALDGDRCVPCGGVTRELDAIEAIARAAIPIDARVHVVHDGLLDRRGGAAALLRF
jgi:hypothetical protein